MRRFTETARRSLRRGGKLFFHIFGALAEFERDLIRERTHAGLATARARGRTEGRPTVMTPDKLATARQLYDERELTVEAIAKVVGVSRASIYRHLVQPARAAQHGGEIGRGAPVRPQAGRRRGGRR